MPGFSFPSVGPLGLGSPPSRSRLLPDHRYYDPLRLPDAHLGFLRFSLSSPDTLPGPALFVSPSGLVRGAWAPSPRRQGFCLCGRRPSGSLFLKTRRHLALPSPRVTPLESCPVLRPRWSPYYSPYRSQGCCLPADTHRRLSLPAPVEAYPYDHDNKISGLHHTA